MEDEIHQICPIIWWHVWDNTPYPKFNNPLYSATDLINCHSHHTFTQLKAFHPEKTNFIPHTVPNSIFNKLPENDVIGHKRTLLGENRDDHFVGIWVNRNAKRKRSSDVLESWKIFIENLEKETGHRNATLIMHCDPHDHEGANLIMVSEMLGIQDSVLFSRDRLDFEQMNILYNISDFCINISFAEGFGLSTLEAMQSGTPIIAAKTGGLTRQVVDHRDESENGVALDIDFRSLVGSQGVPYIYEDYVSATSAANGIMKLYKMSDEERKDLSLKVIDYVKDSFSYDDMIDSWDDSLWSTIKNWKESHERYSIKTI